jgi:hypothetical protein
MTGNAAGAAAQGSTTAAPIMQAADAASSIAPASNVISGLPDLSGVMGAGSPLASSSQILQGLNSMGPATKSMSTMDMIGSALQGAGAATQGVMGLIDSFRDKTKVSPMKFGAINNYLPPMQAGNLGELPQTPQIESSVMQTPYNLEFADNDLFYKLMGAYQG